MDTVISFFLGAEPDVLVNPTANALWHSAKYVIGIILFATLFNLVTWTKKLFKF